MTSPAESASTTGHETPPEPSPTAKKRRSAKRRRRLNPLAVTPVLDSAKPLSDSNVWYRLFKAEVDQSPELKTILRMYDEDFDRCHLKFTARQRLMLCRLLQAGYRRFRAERNKDMERLVHAEYRFIASLQAQAEPEP